MSRCEHIIIGCFPNQHWSFKKDELATLLGGIKSHSKSIHCASLLDLLLRHQVLEEVIFLCSLVNATNFYCYKSTDFDDAESSSAITIKQESSVVSDS